MDAPERKRAAADSYKPKLMHYIIAWQKQEMSCNG
jgi:hypothetical protein